MPPSIITLPQDVDLPPRREVLPDAAAITVVAARSRDTLEAGSIGQDFVAYCYDEARIAFALCDGVSQSFYGDLASRFLGTQLVEWLWQFEGIQTEDTSPFLIGLESVLHTWTVEATALVDAKPIRADLPDMQKIALDRKRVNGSESMFVAGLIDRRADRIALCWMGDSRLHLWDADHQPIELPGEHWETRERWSTRRGPKNGTPRGCILPLGAIRRITAHSDGVGAYVDRFAFLAQDSLIAMIDELRSAPASDDVSVLDVDLHYPPEYGGWQRLDAPAVQIIGDQAIGWSPIPFADSYRIAVDDGRQPFTDYVQVAFNTTDLHYRISDLVGWTHTAPYPVTCRVQAFNEYMLPSAWSAPITITMPVAVHQPAIVSQKLSAIVEPAYTVTGRAPTPIHTKPEPIPEDVVEAVSTAPAYRTRPAFGGMFAVVWTVIVLLLGLLLLLGGSAYIVWLNEARSVIIPS